MRCSSCEPLLDRYVEGTLLPRTMAQVSTHVRDCDACRELLDELKAVDGLLFTTRVPELPQNFTFAVMAEASALPAPRARQHPVWSFLALYSAATWVAAVAALAISGTRPAAVFSVIASELSRAGMVSGAFATGFSRELSRTLPSLAAFAVGVLLIDAVVAGAVVLIYLTVRPRLAAHISSPEALS